MAVTQNPLIGRSRGSVGGVTFTKWKGLNVIKAKPESVENPNTLGQQTQRNRIRTIMAMLRPIKPVIDIGFKEGAVNQSEFNAAVKENILSATDDSAAPIITPDFGNLVVSKGSLSNTAQSSQSGANASADVDIDWPPAVAAPDQAASDIACLCVINETQGTVGYDLSTYTRAAGTGTVTMPTNQVTGDDCHCFLFFVKDDFSKESDSDHALLTI